ncbi:allantoate amidohydrolase [Deinococcus sonorensis]|uniref:Allantoate amidohydrolase n=2 Tax=Deinococcus sonorensis TaxID=309891 RepID=A0AAU7UF44_9DEIO
MAPPDFDRLTQDLLRRIDELCLLTEVPGTITRTFLSETARQMHAALSGWAADLGLSAQVDEAGNWRARLPAAGPDAPTFYIGSHLDTVPDGGKYDGLLGVALGLALAGAVRASGQALPYHLEVLGFSEEEGVRFAVPFIGSLSFIGEVEPLLARTDAQGVTVSEAMQHFGLDPEQLAQAAPQTPALGYLEFHIEQGPVLEAAGQPLGIVSALVGQHRLGLTLTGRANHAGTTPMHLRHDAMSAAAEFILAAEQLALATPGLVATVGRLTAQPGAVNVIAGQVELTLDLRHADDRLRAERLESLLEQLQQLAQRRGVQAQVQVLAEIEAVPLDERLRHTLQAAARTLGLDAPELVSGAGHDAMILSRRMPSSMVFLRTPGGVSHHPAEAVAPADVTAALQLGWHALHTLTQEHP